MAKWLSVHLQNKWLWVGIMLIPSKEFLDIRDTIECRFILKWVHDGTTYRQKQTPYEFIQWLQVEEKLQENSKLYYHRNGKGLALLKMEFQKKNNFFKRILNTYDHAFLRKQIIKVSFLNKMQLEY